MNVLNLRKLFTLTSRRNHKNYFVDVFLKKIGSKWQDTLKLIYGRTRLRRVFGPGNSDEPPTPNPTARSSSYRLSTRSHCPVSDLGVDTLMLRNRPAPVLPALRPRLTTRTVGPSPTVTV